MASDSSNHFEIVEIEEYSYSFISRDGIKYRVFFYPLFEYYPQFVNTYSFSIEPEDGRPHPIDVRIALTVVEILKRFFEKNDQAMIMVCDSLDGKEEKRRKLFDRWFVQYSDGTITKVDGAAHGEGMNLFASLYFKNTNPNRHRLVDAFYEFMKQDVTGIII